MPVLKDEAFVVNFAVPEDAPHAVRVRRPVCHSNWIWGQGLGIARGCRLGDDVVRDHATGISDVQFVREVFIVWKFIVAVTKLGPLSAVLLLLDMSMAFACT